MKTKVQDQVNIWLSTNPDAIESVVQRVVQEGAGQAVMNALKWQFDVHMNDMQQNILSQFGNKC